MQRKQREVMELYFVYDKGQDNQNKEIIIPTIPEGFGYRHEPVIATQPVIGRLTPLNRYIRGGDEIYSFSVRVHNDMLKDHPKLGGKSLVELVEDVKQLSYPIVKQGKPVYPQIYFELGEIAGIAVVDTTIEWVKPIVNGHYVIVDLNFTLRIVRKINLPEMIVVNRIDDRDNNISDVVYASQSFEDYEKMIGRMQGRNYNIDIADLKPRDYHGGYRNYNIEKNVKLQDQQKERLQELYTALTNTEFENDVFAEEFGELFSWAATGEYKVVRDKKGNLKKTLVHGNKKGKGQVDLNKYLKMLDKYRKDYRANTELTTSEVDNLFEGIKDIIKSIFEMEAEVVGYAARN